MNVYLSFIKGSLLVKQHNFFALYMYYIQFKIFLQHGQHKSPERNIKHNNLKRRDLTKIMECLRRTVRSPYQLDQVIHIPPSSTHRIK